MSRPDYLHPDVLVLAGGGVLGELWMHGVLSAMEEHAGVDFRDADAFVGTSAGSILASRLAAGVSPKRPRTATKVSDTNVAVPRRSTATLVSDTVVAVTSPLAPRLLGAPGGALLRAAVLSRVPRGTRRLDQLHALVERGGARFDGRLRICAVDLRRGRRVVFGAPGAPAAGVADAVVASCAIPGYYAPVAIGGRDYVDGGAWSVTNLDAAPAGRGARVLCLDPTSTLSLGPARHAWRAATLLETQALRRRGAKVWRFGPDRAAAALMGDLMDAGPGEQVLAAGWRQGAALSER